MPTTRNSVLIELVGRGDDPFGPISSSASDDPGYGPLAPAQSLDGFLDVSRLALTVGPPLAFGATQADPVQARWVILRLSLPRAWQRTLAAGCAPPKHRSRDLRQSVRTPRRCSARLGGDPTRPTRRLSSPAKRLVRWILSSDDLRGSGAALDLPSAARWHRRAVVVSLGVRWSAARTASGTSTGPRFRLEELVTYDIDVALGGQDVDAEELRELARGARRSSGWVASGSRSRHLARAARAARARRGGERRAHGQLAGARGGARRRGGAARRHHGRGRARRRGGARARRRVPAQPGGSRRSKRPRASGELRPYQQKGLTWLAGMASLPLGAVLADDMGLGKTVQIIALLAARAPAARRADGRGCRPRARQLPDLADRQLAARARTLRAGADACTCTTGRCARRAPRSSTGTTWSSRATGSIARDREMLAGIDWSALIFDEAQSVKNPDTEQARAVRAAARAGPRGAHRYADGEPAARAVGDPRPGQPRAARHRRRRSPSASPRRSSAPATSRLRPTCAR